MILPSEVVRHHDQTICASWEAEVRAAEYFNSSAPYRDLARGMLEIFKNPDRRRLIPLLTAGFIATLGIFGSFTEAQADGVGESLPSDLCPDSVNLTCTAEPGHLRISSVDGISIPQSDFLARIEFARAQWAHSNEIPEGHMLIPSLTTNLDNGYCGKTSAPCINLEAGESITIEVRKGNIFDLTQATTFVPFWSEKPDPSDYWMGDVVDIFDGSAEQLAPVEVVLAAINGGVPSDYASYFGNSPVSGVTPESIATATREFLATPTEVVVSDIPEITPPTNPTSSDSKDFDATPFLHLALAGTLAFGFIKGWLGVKKVVPPKTLPTQTIDYDNSSPRPPQKPPMVTKDEEPLSDQYYAGHKIPLKLLEDQEEEGRKKVARIGVNNDTVWEEYTEKKTKAHAEVAQKKGAWERAKAALEASTDPISMSYHLRKEIETRESYEKAAGSVDGKTLGPRMEAHDELKGLSERDLG